MIICEICKKRIATVHLTEIINGNKREVHLCEECAREQGVVGHSPFSIQDLLSGLLEPYASELPESVKRLKCANCGLTFKEFRETGRLGCANCYEIFKEGLIPLLDKIHGAKQHRGKVIYSRGDKQKEGTRQLIHLKRELDKLVENERYEEAASVRDEIYELEKSPKDKKEKDTASKGDKTGAGSAKEER